MKLHFTRIVFVAILALLACNLQFCKKKQETPSTTEEPGTNTILGTYKMYETGSIPYKGSFQDGATVEAKVNDASITLVSSGDSMLVFIASTPEFKEGENVIKFQDNGGEQKLAIKIEAAVAIQDAQAEVENFINEQTTELNVLKDLSVSDTTGIFNTTEMKGALSAMQQEVDNFKSSWQSLSGEEKEIAAHYIKANQEAFANINAELSDLLNSMNSQGGIMARRTNTVLCDKGSIIENYKCNAEYFDKSLRIFKRSLAAVGVAHLIKFTYPNVAAIIGTAGALGAGVSGAYILYSGTYIVKYKFYLKLVQLAEYKQERGYRTTASPIEFGSDVPKAVPVTITRRNMLESDASSSESWLSEIVTLIGNYNSEIDKFDFLKRFKIKFAAESEKKFNASDLSFLSVQNIDHYRVKFVKIGGTISNPTFVFKTTSINEIDFSFDVVYNDRCNPAITVPVQGRMVKDDDSVQYYQNLVAGTYRVENKETNTSNTAVFSLQPHPSGYHTTHYGKADGTGMGVNNAYWYVQKEDGKYVVHEVGFWHPGYGSMREIILPGPQLRAGTLHYTRK